MYALMHGKPSVDGNTVFKVLENHGSKGHRLTLNWINWTKYRCLKAIRIQERPPDMLLGGFNTVSIYLATICIQSNTVAESYSKLWMKSHCEFMFVHSMNKTICTEFCCTMFCCVTLPILHDDITKWKHFPRYWPVVRTKASDAELWCFLWSASEQTAE